MNNIEPETILPAIDLELCKRFYQDAGFSLSGFMEGVAYFSHTECNFCLRACAKRRDCQMELYVQDLNTWYRDWIKAGLANKYDAELSTISKDSQGRRQFMMQDPSGVLWRVAETNE